MSAEPTSPEDFQMTATRQIQASPTAIFAVLRDPARHQDTEPTDWVGEAIDSAPITGTGQIFGMNMYHKNVGGDYQMYNRVSAFEQDRTIAWQPGQYGDDGELEAGGWSWRYDLAEHDGGTEVTLTYDWSAAPDEMKSSGNLPPFKQSFLQKSLDTLAASVE